MLVATVSRTGLATVAGTEQLKLSIPEGGSAFRDRMWVTVRVDRSDFLQQLRIVARGVPSGRVGSMIIPVEDLPGRHEPTDWVQ